MTPDDESVRARLRRLERVILDDHDAASEDDAGRPMTDGGTVRRRPDPVVVRSGIVSMVVGVVAVVAVSQYGFEPLLAFLLACVSLVLILVPPAYFIIVMDSYFSGGEA